MNLVTDPTSLTLDQLTSHLEGVRGVVVSDTHVQQLYGSLLPNLAWVVFPAGEEQKTAQTYLQVIHDLGNHQIDRKTSIIALGGGVVGDLAGFVAATYNRGIPLIQVPTTLLAMVDSAIGGKVGVDLPAGKNLLGAFKRADQILIAPEFLRTLPEEEYRSGMAEVLKYGLIMDKELWDELQEAYSQEDPRVQEVVWRCALHKNRVVAEDPLEITGLRAILNFGHTVGHALEKEHRYSKRHGEMIAVGMVVEAELGRRLGMENPVEAIAERIRVWGLPTYDTLLSTNQEQLMTAMAKDKKAKAGKLAFSLLDGVGNCRLVEDVDPRLVSEAMDWVCKTFASSC